MSRRTKNSMSTLSEADIECLMMELPSTDRDNAQVCSTEMSDHKDERETQKSEHVVIDIDAEHNAQCLNTKSPCEDCENFKDEITKIINILTDIQSSQDKERKRAEESDMKIEALLEDRDKMAAKIESLEETVTELTRDNNSIKQILDLKQNKWLKVETKAKPPNSKSSTSRPVHTENQFSTLEDENNTLSVTVPESSRSEESEKSINSQIRDYRSKEKSKFNKQSISNSKNKVHPHVVNAPSVKPEKKKVLVIGDSMVKHINKHKIERAAGCESVVHSYNGARVGQISAKIKENWSEGQEYDTVVLHVGTNDLVYDDAEKVATEMDGLIEDLKRHTGKIAVSSVIKRYDGRVAASNITQFNKIVKDLCTQHNIIFIDNDHIDRSLLNGSNLHLNHMGDRVLGGSICTYLKSNRAKTSSKPPMNHQKKIFHHRKRDWTMYLNYVSQALRR